MEEQVKIWILLADTRKKLLGLWACFTALIMVVVFVLTLNGKLADAAVSTWVWAFVCLLPMLSLLFIGVVHNPQPSKVVSRSNFWLVYGSALGYLLLTFSTLFGFEGWLMSHTEEGDGISRYFSVSYLWLAPFQVLLLAGAWFLYFYKTPLFQPTEKKLKGYIETKAEYAERLGNKNQEKAFNLLKKNEFEQLFVFLASSLPDKQERDMQIVLETRYHRFKKEKEFNIGEPPELEREVNKITMSLIDVIEKL